MSAIPQTPIKVADYCASLTQRHYENFPVASFLLPRHLRQPIVAIYAFARTADDFADEGQLDPQTRLTLIDDYVSQLRALENGGVPTSIIFSALAQAINDFKLPFSPFYDLLSAFRQDVLKKRYATVPEVLDYCRRSANPIGRLLLHIFKQANDQTAAYSDAICTALQLINFLLDIQADWQKGRIYLPMDEVAHHDITEQQFAQWQANSAWKALINLQIARADSLLKTGTPLGAHLKGRQGFEIRLTIAGGTTVLQKLRYQNAHGIMNNARLTRLDWVKILISAIK